MEKWMNDAQYHNLTSMLALILRALESIDQEKVLAEAQRKLADGDFAGAQLDLTSIDLSGVDLSEADLTGSDLHHANLSDTDLTETMRLTWLAPT
jgi:uncharacterized protein YjbI with pentapeptide repeats